MPYLHHFFAYYWTLAFVFVYAVDALAVFSLSTSDRYCKPKCDLNPSLWPGGSCNSLQMWIWAPGLCCRTVLWFSFTTEQERSTNSWWDSRSEDVQVSSPDAPCPRSLQHRSRFRGVQRASSSLDL